ncbi:unnamed protein product, partial [Mesorhabditis spiculigera]
MADAARIAEAAQCERKAAECLKTSMIKLKFNPDYDGAATALERASVCYRNAQKHLQASKALQEAAGHYEMCNNKFHAAKARENAAMLLRDAGDTSGAFPLFVQAINGYAECGNLDTAALSIDRAVKVIERDDPKKAIELYERGLELVQSCDRTKQAGEFLSGITKLSLRLEDYSSALRAIRREIEAYADVKEYLRIGQLAIGAVLIQLARGDSVAALKEYGWAIQQCPDFEHTDDASACQSLIASYESGDDANFQNALKRGSVRSMDNEPDCVPSGSQEVKELQLPNIDAVSTPANIIPHRRKCNRCGIWFASRRLLFAHRKVHYPDRTVCTICGAVLRLGTEYGEHLRDKHNKGPIGRGCEGLARDITEVPEATGDDKQICTTCGYVASSAKQLWRHGKKESHSTRVAQVKVDEWPCPECDYKTKVKMNWQRHLFRKHGIGNTPAPPREASPSEVTCSDCLRSFANISSLNRHIRMVHTDERKHACGCGQVFKLSDHLRRHQERKRCPELKT